MKNAVLLALLLSACTTVRDVEVANEYLSSSLGRQHEITTKNGELVKGRLVRQRNQWAEICSSPRDCIRIPVDSIAGMTHLRRPRRSALRSMGKGLLAGVVAGAIIGSAQGSDDPNQWFSMTAGQKAGAYAVLLAIPGALAGGVISANSRFEVRYQDAEAGVDGLRFQGRSRKWLVGIQSGNISMNTRAMDRALVNAGFGDTRPGYCFFGCIDSKKYPVRLSGSSSFQLTAGRRVSPLWTAEIRYASAKTAGSEGYRDDPDAFLGQHVAIRPRVTLVEALARFEPSTIVHLAAGPGLYSVRLGDTHSTPGVTAEAGLHSPTNRAFYVTMAAQYRLVASTSHDVAVSVGSRYELDFSRPGLEQRDLGPIDLNLSGFSWAVGAGLRF